MRHSLRFNSLVLLILGIVAAMTTGQELKPGVRFSPEGSASWSEDGNWDFDGAPGVPGEGEVASIRSGGTATVSGAVPKVDAVAIIDGSVDVQAGGTLESDSVVIGSGGALNLGGSVNAGTFAVVGTLQLNGGTVEASGAAAFGAGATIDLAAGTDLGFGSSVPFLTAGSLTTQQPSFTVGGAAPSLERGLGLRLTQAGTVDVGSVPVATIDRGTGNITLSNPTGGDVGLLGLTLTSGRGLLNGEAVDVPEWTTANTDLASEITQLSVTPQVLPVGGSINLGAGWGGTTVSPREEDVELSVLLDDGTILAGLVEYAGPANDLVLDIDPETGSATLQHLSESLPALDVIGYTISSSSGSLNVAGFTGSVGEGFSKANPQATAIGEISFDAATQFATGTVIDLGSIYTPGSAQDLVLEFGVAGSDAVLPGTVQFGGGATPPVVLCDPNTQGDIDGDGTVGFSDFLVLSSNFGQAVTSHTDGDIDCGGDVAFADFLVLSTNFGNTVGAETASVPEPATGILVFLGILGMLKFRKPVSRAAVVAVACSALLAANPTDSFAQSFEGTFLQIHPEGPNNQINTTTEARGILNGTVLDVIINEVVTQTDDILTVDFGGGGGNFANDQNPYSNGVEGADMNDFIQYVSGTITIPEGEWTVGFGSDDGGFLNLPGISFDETFNEGGSGRIDGDGEILFDGTRGHNWTAATFTVSEDTTTGFEALMFERGGGDSLEVAYVNAIYDPEIDGGLNEFMASGFELDNGDFGDWSLTDDPFVPAGASSDLNGDGNVDFADFTIMSDNWGNPYGFDEFHALTQSFGGAGEAASVPEPTSLSLSLVSVLLLFGARRRRR